MPVRGRAALARGRAAVGLSKDWRVHITAKASFQGVKSVSPWLCLDAEMLRQRPDALRYSGGKLLRLRLRFLQGWLGPETGL